MRKSEFIEIVRTPENLSCEKTTELQKLVKDFPWFQSAQMLLCRNLNVCENMGFEKQLRIAAAYSTDRVRLHQLVMERIAPTVKETQDVKDQVQKAEIQKTENHTQAESEESKKSIEKPQEKEFTLEKVDKETETSLSPEDDYLNKQILSHAISNSNLLKIEEEENSVVAPLEFEEHIKLPEQTKEEPKNDFDENSPHSFTDWLKHVENLGKEGKKIDKYENESIEEEFTFETKENLNDQNTPKKKASFYNPTEMAKLSVKEDDDLISETLARIYAQQGNYEKAINAYKKLSLKYPEKKIYFANQIKTLEENLNP